MPESPPYPSSANGEASKEKRIDVKRVNRQIAMAKTPEENRDFLDGNRTHAELEQLWPRK